MTEPTVEHGTALKLVWKDDGDAPVVFADHLSLLKVGGNVFLVMGQSQPPADLSSSQDKTVPIKAIIKLVLSTSTAAQMAQIISRAVEDNG